MARSIALTMPYVTVLVSASGEPKASTGSPTTTWSELPNCTGGRPLLSSLSTAMSDSGSVPTNWAAALLASLNTTVAVPLSPLITWSLVTTYPSLDTMKPEPRLVPLPVPTRTVTTLGSTFLTAPASESGGRCAAPAVVPLPPAPRIGCPPVPTPPRWAKKYPSVPPSPPASSAVTIATRKTRPRPRRIGTAVTGSGAGTPSPTALVRITTAAGEAGSRHGSCSASDHQTSWRPEPSVTIGTPHFVTYQDYTLPPVVPRPVRHPGEPTGPA